ncbi:MAG: flagellar hook basal-body protein [Planctomycetota bacterium]
MKWRIAAWMGVGLLFAGMYWAERDKDPSQEAERRTERREAREQSREAVRQAHTRTLDGIHAAYDVLLVNLAHAQTPGYRAVRPIFEQVEDADASGQATAMWPVMHRDPSPGPPIETGRWLDVAIDGPGYFVVNDPTAGGADGLAYARTGRLYIDAEGALVIDRPHGPRLEPRTTFPDDFMDLWIQPDGQVMARHRANQPWIAIGQIHLARFGYDAGLEQVRENRLIATAKSGQPLVDIPGGTGLGVLRGGYIEGSNVDVAAELTQLNQLRTWGLSLAAGLGIERDFRRPGFAAAAPPTNGTEPPGPSTRLSATSR